MQKPNAFIFAGANASGKSTFIAHLKSQNIIYGEYINPDLILKEELKLNESYENYLKAFELAKQKREIAIRNKKNIILERIFSTEDKIDFLEQLKQNGYEITLFFTGTENADINVLYLKRRVEEGGHDVPIRKLLDRRKRGFKNIKKVLSRIDCIVFIDNSIINEPPIIVKSLYKIFIHAISSSIILTSKSIITANAPLFIAIFISDLLQAKNASPSFTFCISVCICVINDIDGEFDNFPSTISTRAVICIA